LINVISHIIAKVIPRIICNNNNEYSNPELREWMTSINIDIWVDYETLDMQNKIKYGRYGRYAGMLNPV